MSALAQHHAERAAQASYDRQAPDEIDALDEGYAELMRERRELTKAYAALDELVAKHVDASKVDPEDFHHAAQAVRHQAEMVRIEANYLANVSERRIVL